MTPADWLEGHGPREALGVLEELARLDLEDRELLAAVVAARVALGEGREATFLLRLAEALELASRRSVSIERWLQPPDGVEA